MQKLFKIQEIADLYGVSADTLRYYEKLGLIAPKREPNGYRTYSLTDIWRLNVIRDLREMDVPMEKIKKYLQNRTTHTTALLLQEELRLLDEEIQNMTHLRDSVAERLQNIRDAEAHPTGVVERLSLPQRRCHLIREGYQADEEMDMLIKRLLNMDEDITVIGNNRIGSLLSLDGVKREDFRHTGVFLLSDYGEDSLPQGDYLSVFYRGDTGQNPHYLNMLMDHAAREKLIPAEPVVELLWVDIHSSTHRSEDLTELQIRVTC